MCKWQGIQIEKPSMQRALMEIALLGVRPCPPYLHQGAGEMLSLPAAIGDSVGSWRSTDSAPPD